MAVTGIIAEYNPLHKGHLHQIRQVKAQRRAELLVVVMSGSFVQRGEPALVDKWRRCAMALEAGADLVLELPPAYATGSAEVFARGAVGVLKACGFVEELVFGASSPDTASLETLAEQTEEPSFKTELQQGLQKGLSYPAALGTAMEKQNPTGAALLKDANNLLGVEYIRAMKKQGAPWRAIALERQGEAHGSLTLPEEGYASGSAIRRALEAGDSRALDYLAPGVAEKLDYQILPADISPALSAVLLEQSLLGRSRLCEFADINDELAGSILAQAPFDRHFPELVERIGSRAFTAARIRRSLLHILLRIRKEDQAGLPGSLKILGIRTGSEAGALLKQKATLPVITKTADAARDLAEEYAYPQRVYNQAVYFKSGICLPEDYSQSPLCM